MRKKIPGIPLSELIKNNSDYNPSLILKNILDQAISLEKNNFYHTDLRPRNTLILDSGEALLIDYGAIEHKEERYLQGYFFIIMLGYEIFQKKHVIIRKLHPACIMNEDLHPLYRRWLKLILSVPNKYWTFPLFQHFLEEAKNREPVCSIDYENFQKWTKKICRLIDSRRMRLRRFEMLVAKKLNHYFKKPSFKRVILSSIWERFIILYDTISLPIKSIFITKDKLCTKE